MCLIHHEKVMKINVNIRTTDLTRGPFLGVTPVLQFMFFPLHVGLKIAVLFHIFLIGSLSKPTRIFDMHLCCSGWKLLSYVWAIFNVNYLVEEILQIFFLNYYTSYTLWISFSFTLQINSAPKHLYEFNNWSYICYKLIFFLYKLLHLT